jgi:hydroxypyruvate isomerase
MASIQQSIAWWCFVPRAMTADDFLRAAVASGYAAIELAPAEMFDTIKRHGLRLSGIGGHGSIESGLNRRDNHARIEAELREKIALAEKHEIPNLICFSGSRAGLPDAEGVAITAEGLRRVAPMAESAGVNLVIELLNSRVDHPDYQCDHTAWGVEVVKAVDSPRVKLLYDIYHAQIMEGDLIRNFREAAPYIAHVHTAGNPGRHEIDETQEIYYPPVLAAIRDSGYTGYVAHEFVPTRDPAAVMRETFAACARWL